MQVEPTLSEDVPLHGDIDTVNSLQEEHKAFQQELGESQLREEGGCGLVRKEQKTEVK